MKTVLALLLFASTAFAQTSETTRISKGDLLKQRQYQTNGNLTFYVDPLGDDANQCTSTTTAACLTIQGALNKAPKLLRHQVTVNVAAGNYAGFIVSGFTIDPSVQKTTGGILIDGVLGTASVATGSATGTATAGTAGSVTTAVFGTLTDGAQTWTISDLRGKFITITGGTGSGQIRAITANTATVITVAGSWTAPDGTSTYTIQTPSAIITSTTAAILTGTGATAVTAAGIQVFDNNAGGNAASSTVGIIAFRNLGVSLTGAPTNIFNSPSTYFFQSNLTGTTASTFSASAVAFSHSSCISTSGCFITTGFAQLTANQSYMQGVATSLATASNQARVAYNATQFITSGASAGCITASGNASGAVTGCICDCASGATSGGLFVGGASVITSAQSASFQFIGTFSVVNCTYGIAVNSGGYVGFSNATADLAGNSLTYSVMSTNGGKVTLPDSITITSGTADLALDNGATTSSFASLAAIYSCLASIATGSSICRL